MKCDQHPENEVVSLCVSCGKKLCPECDYIYNNKHYCSDCKDEPIKQKEIQISAKKKSAQTKIDIVTIIGIIWGIITSIVTLIFILLIGFTLTTDTSLYGGSNPGVGISIFFGFIWLIFVAILVVIILQIKGMKKKKNLI